MKRALYVLAITLCAALVGLAISLPMEPVQADPAKKPDAATGSATAEVVTYPDSLTGTCEISCSDGSGTTTIADNAGDCACDCSRYCDEPCEASGGGQTATCDAN